MHWQKITLVGVGLLGGSLGMALRARKLADHVTGYVRRVASIEEAQRLGAVDRATCDLAEAVTNADLVVLCTPIAQMAELAERMAPVLKRQAVVTDVGSAKASVVEHLESLIEKAGGRFVGSHPMAGAEKMGVQWARADLFNGALVAITATPNSAVAAVRCVDDLWRLVGGRTLHLSPEQHDEYVSRSSHLPHILAAELANYVLSPAYPKEQALLCANGFRDTTRIASGSPEMWRDIALANRKHLARVLGVVIEDLQEVQLALERGDVKTVLEFFELAKQRRDRWCEQTGESKDS